jgi:hypothetical protein
LSAVWQDGGWSTEGFCFKNRVGIYGDGVFREAEHGEVGFAVRVGPDAWEGQGTVRKEVPHGWELRFVLVVGSIDAGDKGQPRAIPADFGGDGVVELQHPADGGGVDVGAGGIEDERAAFPAVAFRCGHDFRVEERADFGSGKGFRHFGQTIRGHAPEVGKKDALESAGTDRSGGAQGGYGQESREVDSPPALSPEHIIAEQGLGIVGQQRLVEIEEGNGHGRAERATVRMLSAGVKAGVPAGHAGASQTLTWADSTLKVHTE